MIISELKDAITEVQRVIREVKEVEINGFFLKDSIKNPRRKQRGIKPAFVNKFPPKQ